MKTAYVFPGQGSQFPGMGKKMYDQNPIAKELFEMADETLGFSLSKIMFEGTEEELKQTRVTQPAVFLHSYIAYRCHRNDNPDMVAGHSLGEFTALTANGCLSFEDALRLVEKRALAMQKACELQPSSMAAVLKFDTETIEKICASITDDVVVPANYNSPQQLVISGSLTGLEKATVMLKEAGARLVKPLTVGGAFHSPLMQPAQDELAQAIEQCEFHQPVCPIYQNATAQPASDPAVIKANLLQQLTSPVKWTQSVLQMVADGCTNFIEFGPGATLQGLIKRIDDSVEAIILGEDF